MTQNYQIANPRQPSLRPRNNLNSRSLDERGFKQCLTKRNLSSDGGALLIREAAEINGIIDAMAASIRDKRDQAHVQHKLCELISQRVVQICHGYDKMPMTVTLCVTIRYLR